MTRCSVRRALTTSRDRGRGSGDECPDVALGVEGKKEREEGGREKEGGGRRRREGEVRGKGEGRREEGNGRRAST